MSLRFLRFFFLVSLLGPAPALADGSVIFSEDVLPLLHKQPELRAALADIRFDRPGSGRRISGKVSPGLAGRRIGPYEFRAVEKNKEVSVQFATYTRFFDSSGRLLGEDEGDGDDLNLDGAVRLEEEVVAVGVTPVSGSGQK